MSSHGRGAIAGGRRIFSLLNLAFLLILMFWFSIPDIAFIATIYLALVTLALQLTSRLVPELDIYRQYKRGALGSI